jgi:hypothetical protein
MRLHHRIVAVSVLIASSVGGAFAPPAVAGEPVVWTDVRGVIGVQFENGGTGIRVMVSMYCNPQYTEQAAMVSISQLDPAGDNVHAERAVGPAKFPGCGAIEKFGITLRRAFNEETGKRQDFLLAGLADVTSILTANGRGQLVTGISSKTFDLD